MTLSKVDPERSRLARRLREMETEIHGGSLAPRFESTVDRTESEFWARVFLFNALKVLAPDSIEELAALATAEASDLDRKQTQWAERHRLNGPLVIESCRKTVQLWKILPESLEAREIRHASNPGFVGPRVLESDGKQAYDPTRESRSRARARLRDRPTEYFDRRERELRGTGFDDCARPSEVAAQRFVRFQVLGESYRQISLEERLHRLEERLHPDGGRAGVRQSVKRFAGRLQITPRPASRPGRPKKKK